LVSAHGAVSQIKHDTVSVDSVSRANVKADDEFGFTVQREPQVTATMIE
jgi:hypothetical protein